MGKMFRMIYFLGSKWFHNRCWLKILNADFRMLIDRMLRARRVFQSAIRIQHSALSASL